MGSLVKRWADVGDGLQMNEVGVEFFESRIPANSRPEHRASQMVPCLFECSGRLDDLGTRELPTSSHQPGEPHVCASRAQRCSRDIDSTAQPRYCTVVGLDADVCDFACAKPTCKSYSAAQRQKQGVHGGVSCLRGTLMLCLRPRHLCDARREWRCGRVLAAAVSTQLFKRREQNGGPPRKARHLNISPIGLQLASLRSDLSTCSTEMALCGPRMPHLAVPTGPNCQTAFREAVAPCIPYQLLEALVHLHLLHVDQTGPTTKTLSVVSVCGPALSAHRDHIQPFLSTFDLEKLYAPRGTVAGSRYGERVPLCRCSSHPLHPILYARDVGLISTNDSNCQLTSSSTIPEAACYPITISIPSVPCFKKGKAVRQIVIKQRITSRIKEN
jgi:hypothetical protein